MHIYALLYYVCIMLIYALFTMYASCLFMHYILCVYHAYLCIILLCMYHAYLCIILLFMYHAYLFDSTRTSIQIFIQFHVCILFIYCRKRRKKIYGNNNMPPSKYSKVPDFIWAGPCENVSSGICDQRRPRLARSSAQSDQGYRCPLTGLLYTREHINGEQMSGRDFCACSKMPYRLITLDKVIILLFIDRRAFYICRDVCL